MNKPKILILMCEGGGGHKSASVALQEILGSDYEIEVMNAIATIFAPIDWMRICTFGKRYGEDIYNFLLQKDHYKLLKYFVKIGNGYLIFNKRKLAKIFEKILLSQKQLPDLIISTIPFMNEGLLTAAHRLNIPFLLVPTDLDTQGFLLGFDKIEREVLEKFKMAVAYERPEIVLQVFKHSILEPSDLVFSGFPVHPECQKKYSAEETNSLKTTFGHSTDKKIVTLVMGAAGSGTIFDHTQVIATLSPDLCGGPFEANICVGRNQRIAAKIIDWLQKENGRIVQKNEEKTTIAMPEGVVLHIRGFTRDLPRIMACSDLIISKTGSCSVNEAIYLGKKILLDNTPLSSSRYLSWEQFNVHFVKRHNLGAVFTQSEDLRSLIPFLLNHMTTSRRALALPDFQTNIRALVASLIQ